MDTPIPAPQADPPVQFVARLQRFLTSEWKRQNTPHGLKAAWGEAIIPDGDATSKIFRIAGFKAWLAFFLATREAGSHRKGKKVGDTLKSSLDNLPPSSIQEIARIVKDTAAHPTVHQAICRMSTQLEHSGEELPRSPALAATSSPTLTPIATAHNTLQTNLTNAYGSEICCDLGNADSLVTLNSDDEGQRFATASPQGVMTVFPPFLCGAIRMIGTEVATKAAVAMHFPYRQYGAIHCLMSLGIVPSRLAVVTKELFGITLEIRSGLLYIINMGGGMLLPMPTVTLQGASREGIVSVLGDIIDRGIEASPERKNELWQAIRHTSCVIYLLERLRKVKKAS